MRAPRTIPRHHHQESAVPTNSPQFAGIAHSSSTAPRSTPETDVTYLTAKSRMCDCVCVRRLWRRARVPHEGAHSSHLLCTTRPKATYLEPRRQTPSTLCQLTAASIPSTAARAAPPVNPVSTGTRQFVDQLACLSNTRTCGARATPRADHDAS